MSRCGTRMTVYEPWGWERRVRLKRHQSAGRTPSPALTAYRIASWAPRFDRGRGSSPSAPIGAWERGAGCDPLLIGRATVTARAAH